MASYPTMQTPDGVWVVEVYRKPQTRSHWYRLRHGENLVEGLTIVGVQRLLTEAGYDMADLVEVSGDEVNLSDGSATADGAA